MNKNPYPGLRPFEYEDAKLFFGREGRSEDVLRRLQESHFLAVVGTSGSGKSSLVRAGLLPLLYSGFMFNAGSRWRIAIMRPGNSPISNLANALVYPPSFTVKTLGKTDAPNPFDLPAEMKVEIVESILRRSSVGLLDYINGGELEPEENLLLVVDQFEELFRFKDDIEPEASAKDELEDEFLHEDDAGESFFDKKSARNSPEEKAAFVKLLLEGTSDVSKRIYVVITMRSDYLGDCSKFRGLPEAINKGQYLIPRLTREQLRSAIEKPAERHEAETQKQKGEISPVLVNQLLNDVGDDQDQLPILQHALMRMWGNWAKQQSLPESIDLKAYENVGGWADALSNHAEEAFEDLLPNQQIIAEKIFKCLTNVDAINRETRRETKLSEISAITKTPIEEVKEIIEVFHDNDSRNFLTISPSDKPLHSASIIDITHESLIRKWKRLAKWVEEEAASAEQYRNLARDAYLESIGDMGYLSDPELRIARLWRVRNRPNADWAERYHQGQRYPLDFQQAIEYLRKSKIDYKQKLAQRRILEQDRLTRQIEREQYEKMSRLARKLRLAMVAVLIMFLISIGLAIYAFRSATAARASEARTRELLGEQTRLNGELEKSYKEIQGNRDLLKKINDELTENNTVLGKTRDKLRDSLTAQEKATEEAEAERKRANAEAEQAKQSEADKEKALGEQKRLAGELKNALDASTASLAREELNRDGLILFERGQYSEAEVKFTKLLAEYQSDPYLKEEDRKTGKWWASHTLGTIYRRMDNFQKSEIAYTNAVNIFGESFTPIGGQAELSDEPVNYFQKVSFTQSAPQQSYEVTRNIIATLRKLAQLYSTRASSSTYDEEVKKYNRQAFVVYQRLFQLETKENVSNEELPNLIEDFSEAASVSFKLKENVSAEKYYKEVLDYYDKVGKDGVKDLKAIPIIKNLAQISVEKGEFDKAREFYNEILDIQQFYSQNLLYDLEVASVYEAISRIFREEAKFYEEARSKNYAKSAELNQELNQTPLETEKQQIRQEIETLYKEYNEMIKNYSAATAKFYSYKSVADSIKGFADAPSPQFSSYRYLAQNYSAIGECAKGEGVINDGLKKFTETTQSRPIDYEIKIDALFETAKFYESNFPNNQKAEKYYLAVVKELEREDFVNLFKGFTSYEIEGYKDISSQTGNALLKRGKLAEAEQLIKRYLFLLDINNKAYPDSKKNFYIEADTFILLAEIYEAQAQLPKAEEIYKNLINRLDVSVNQAVNNTDSTLLPRKEPDVSEESVRKAYVRFKLAKLIIKQNAANTNVAQEQQLEPAREIFVKYWNTPAMNKPAYIEAYIETLIIDGDIEKIENDFAHAARLYEQAFKVLSDYQNLQSAKYGSKYFTYGIETSEFYTKRAEILEAWVSVNSEKASELNAQAGMDRQRAANSKALEEAQKATQTPCPKATK
jgi:tetratricopeptide (TPR) repeat protein/energy-coupling factor transporter ATP-binding protein EcfA2